MRSERLSDVSGSSLARRVLVAAAVAAAVIIVLLLLWSAATVFLLGFTAVLIAILFQGITYWVQSKAKMSYSAAFALVLTATIGAIAFVVWLAAPIVADQVASLRSELPQAIRSLHNSLRQQGWARMILDQLPDPESLFTGGSRAITNPTTILSTAFGAVGHIIFVLFMFVFVAFDPRLYRTGIELLVPPRYRSRASGLLDNIWTTLWRWLAARAVAMAAVGVMTTTGLMMLGIPMALALGLIAALFDFVPNVGPIVAAIPAILIAAVQSPQSALYVALLYFGIQMAEGNIITPLAQQRAIDMPPALLLVSQFVLGSIFGIVGFIVATPLAAVALVLVRELYVEAEPQTS